jgi:predicted protein tyrosine phosphatase
MTERTPPLYSLNNEENEDDAIYTLPTAHRNLLANTQSNPYQNSKFHPRCLCVCSAGLLRSPTTAVILSRHPFNRNTRAIGSSVEFSLIPPSKVLLSWAQEVVCMETRHSNEIAIFYRVNEIEQPPTYVFGIPDNHDYRNPMLEQLIYEAALAQMSIYTADGEELIGAEPTIS